MKPINYKWMTVAVISVVIYSGGLLAGFASGKAPLAGQVLFVVPNGHDSASGSAAAPFRTIAGAQAAIRRLKAVGKFPLGGVKVFGWRWHLLPAQTHRVHRGRFWLAAKPHSLCRCAWGTCHYQWRSTAAITLAALEAWHHAGASADRPHD